MSQSLCILSYTAVEGYNYIGYEKPCYTRCHGWLSEIFYDFQLEVGLPEDSFSTWTSLCSVSSEGRCFVWPTDTSQFFYINIYVRIIRNSIFIVLHIFKLFSRVSFSWVLVFPKWNCFVHNVQYVYILLVLNDLKQRNSFVKEMCFFFKYWARVMAQTMARASHREGPGLLPGHYMQDIWWTK